MPYQVSEAVAPPYHAAGPLRRVWSVVASSGLALVIGAVLATVTAFALAWIVTTLTDLLQAVIDRRAVAVAGHTGDVGRRRRGRRRHDDGGVGSTALGALDRLGALDDATVTAAFADPDPAVRRRAVELAARHPGVDLRSPLADDDPSVVEVAAWACGEHEVVGDDVVRHARRSGQRRRRRARAARARGRRRRARGDR